MATLLAPAAENIGRGSSLHRYEDFVEIIMPKLSAYDLDILLYWGDQDRPDPARRGIVFDPKMFLRWLILREDAATREIGYQYDSNVNDLIATQAWTPDPFETWFREKPLTVRSGMNYHHIPMAVSPSRIVTGVTKTKKYLYYASVDQHKTELKATLGALLPKMDIIYAQYTDPSSAILEQVAPYEFVFTAGYSAVEALAMGCKVVCASRNFYGAIHSGNIDHVSDCGFTWFNEGTRERNQDVGGPMTTKSSKPLGSTKNVAPGKAFRVSAKMLADALDQAEVISADRFLLTNYITDFQNICGAE